MVASDIRISWCYPISLCKEEDKNKLVFLFKKRVPSKRQGKYIKHYEYIYILWTNKEKGKAEYFRSNELI